jgi:dephospho-CoA kinase
MTRLPLFVGITGGIGSGKSLVCKAFSHLDIPIYDADSHARKLMLKDLELIESIKNNFGEACYFPDGKLNREFLATKAFKNDLSLRQLNELVHPKVGTDFKQWSVLQSGLPYVIKEAALLIESGSYKDLDQLIVIKASKEKRIERVLLRDSFRSKSEIEAIIDKQLTDAEFEKHADHVINNNETQLLLPVIIKMHEKFLELAGQRG